MNEELYELWSGRITELAKQFSENGEIVLENESVKEYFAEAFAFAQKLIENYELIKNAGGARAILASEADDKLFDEIKKNNQALYSGIFCENYKNSYVNPTVAAASFGADMGRLLSFALAELRGAIPSTYMSDLEDLNIRLEMLLGLYSCFISAAEEDENASADEVKEYLYSFIYDHMEMQTGKKLKSQLAPDYQPWAAGKLKYWSDERILFLTGEYVGRNELEMFRYLKGIPEDKLKLMADTFTGGYVKGFEVTGRSLSIKDTAELRFNIGFIPMIKMAIANLEKEKLAPTMMRAGYCIFTGRSVDKNGFFGSNPNPQYDIDHKDDYALFLDKKLNNRRVECLQNAFKELKREAGVYAGPAVIDIFGEKQFEPENKPEASSHNDATRKLITEYASKAGQITNTYIPGDERSFTIIAFPLPSIGERFEEIFDDTIKINTLDYTLYRDIQQSIIDTLDKAEYVYVKGTGNNKTDLLVKLYELDNPQKQTIFENCVADVNIPVGEVFTSPVLKGTNGILHVCRVFLNGLEYRDLSLEIKDGMIADYNCENGKKQIEDNILYHHKTLPIGECAIGTNTTAYEVARRYGIEALMPILIAEKTGPHFAFGDTCYSHCEELAVYNPDGKEIVARENECSLLRNTDPANAYFNCHTDITIPYDELGELSAVTKTGEHIPIIENGFFVLPGTEKLNEPLKKIE